MRTPANEREGFAALRTTFGALRHRNYRIWAGAGFVSVIGTWMQVLGVNWYVLQQTGSATSMGFAVLLQALPTLLLSSWGGALADRLPARPLLISTQVGHAALAAGLAMLAWSDAPQMSMIYAISLVSGALTAIEGPVMGRYGSTMVDRETLGNALALGSLTNSAGRILGMSLGAVVVAATGPALLFVVNAVSFAAVVAALFSVRQRDLYQPEPDPEGHPEVRHGIRAGLSYLRRQPVILTALALAFVLGSLGRNYQVTMAAMSAGPFGGGAAVYGLLSTVFAVGTVLGALAAARRRHLSYGLLIGAGVVASVLQAVAGLAPGVWSFALAILPIAAAAVIIDTTVGTRAQLDTDGAMRGRVLAAVAVTGSVAAAVGAPGLGWLSEHAGPRQTLVLAGCVGLFASAGAGLALARRQRTAVAPGLPLPTTAGTLPATAGRVPAMARSRAGRLRVAGGGSIGRMPAVRLRRLSRTYPGDHVLVPAVDHGPRTGRSGRARAAAEPRYVPPQRQYAEAASRPAAEAGSPTPSTPPRP
ncbi:MFS family permease [Plantactinospora soyae]|uniref:MFS family permease n=1 Tax=Plantactinospora soyae TaxID=1544732 RepID=A0A927QVU0_9ACTN|nr:MFS family permease [Plantactinospora soyae]